MVALPIIVPRLAAESASGLLEPWGRAGSEGCHTFAHDGGFGTGGSLWASVVLSMQREK